MKNKLSYAGFWLRYQWFNLVTKFTKKTPTRYMMVLMGRFPSNLQLVLNNIVVQGQEFRYSIGPNCIVVLFYSKKNFEQVDELLRVGLEGGVDHFVLATLNDFTRQFFTLNMRGNMYHNLFGEKDYDSPFSKLEGMQSVIDLVNATKARMNIFIQEITRDMNDFDTELRKQNELIEKTEREFEASKPAEPTEEEVEKEINDILDKIASTGYDSLTETEKLKLTKYGK